MLGNSERHSATVHKSKEMNKKNGVLVLLNEAIMQKESGYNIITYLNKCTYPHSPWRESGSHKTRSLAGEENNKDSPGIAELTMSAAGW